MAIFSGLSTAYGVYKVDPKAPKVGDKAKGKALTVRGEVTLELWEKHVAGEEGLGIVPINENGECLWGVIDIDQYDLKIKDVIKKIKDLKLPLIVVAPSQAGLMYSSCSRSHSLLQMYRCDSVKLRRYSVLDPQKFSLSRSRWTSSGVMLEIG